MDRDVTVMASDQEWVAEFTYLWTTEGWMYVAVVLESYSRRAVDMSMLETLTVQLVADALLTAM
ncbi:hypothetical protein [Gemmatimonas groenlandica]|uniref:Integrase catalytic domain-containing protein n=1 Tax=Gemmatimonas groenlandica TaxID=2732249 RepID=A0A6M4IRS7_9BACT|nr:hypothetical protein [Gemmatimonas groenlandica]QJR36217.1 hypothetical protein HKW67_12215 [Gemmatimonas groenlandica]